MTIELRQTRLPGVGVKYVVQPGPRRPRSR